MSLAALKRFANKRPAAEERCELCGATLSPAHAHLVEPAERKLICACDPCAVLFDHPAGSVGKFRRVPRDAFRLPNFKMSDEQWARFEIPIGVAFFFKSSPAQRVVAFYPSPAGAVESLLALDAWDALAAENPALDDFAPDVEALLVNRMKESRAYFRAPIDECYRLAGLIRLHWRGFTGGAEVWKEIDGSFAALQSKGRIQP